MLSKLRTWFKNLPDTFRAHFEYVMYADEYEIIKIEEDAGGVELILKLKSAYIAYKNIHFIDNKLQYNVGFFAPNMTILNPSPCLYKVANNILYKIYFNKPFNAKLASVIICSALLINDANLKNVYPYYPHRYAKHHYMRQA